MDNGCPSMYKLVHIEALCPTEGILNCSRSISLNFYPGRTFITTSIDSYIKELTATDPCGYAKTSLINKQSIDVCQIL